MNDIQKQLCPKIFTVLITINVCVYILLSKNYFFFLNVIECRLRGCPKTGTIRNRIKNNNNNNNIGLVDDDVMLAAYIMTRKLMRSSLPIYQEKKTILPWTIEWPERKKIEILNFCETNYKWNAFAYEMCPRNNGNLIPNYLIFK